MPLVLPYPNIPQNGQPLDATPVLANIIAITQAIQSFDGSQVQAGTLQAAAFASNINPVTITKETESSFVSSGAVWSTVSGLSGTMTGGVAYIVGNRVTLTGVGSNTFSASKDTYIDIDLLGNIYYQAVTNGAAAPAITANAIRVAKVVTNGSAITSIVQFGADSLGNIIYPSGPVSAKQVQNPYKFSAYRNAAQSTGAGVWVKVNIETKLFDTGANFDNTTNFRFVAPVNGYYHFNAQASINASSSAFLIALYKNGAEWVRGNKQGVTGSAGAVLSELMQLNAGDYVELWVFSTSAVALEVGAVSPHPTFSGHLVSTS